MVIRTWYIYKITNLLTREGYVGQRKLDTGKTPLTDKYWGSGTIIQQSIKKNGLENFKKEILKENIRCQTAADIFEQAFIKKENTLHPNGYNILSVPFRCGSRAGIEVSEEHRRKISEANRGRKKTLEMRRKLSETLRGHIVTEETRQKLSQKNKGYKHTEEAKRKMSELRQKGVSQETRDKLSKVSKGKIVSEEVREKIRQTLLGHVVSEETKRRTQETKRRNKILRQNG